MIDLGSHVSCPIIVVVDDMVQLEGILQLGGGIENEYGILHLAPHE